MHNRASPTCSLEIARRCTRSFTSWDLKALRKISKHSPFTPRVSAPARKRARNRPREMPLSLL